MGGFVVGLILLFFFLGGKKTSCDYGMDARVLKNIRNKEIVYSEVALNSLRSRQLDSSDVGQILRKGDVDFSESNTKLDSCKQYVIEGTLEQIKMRIRVENCAKIATIMTATFSE